MPVSPGHNAAVQSLLYQFAQWYALAKLRIHTNLTLLFFEETFKKLSRKWRKFQDYTCTAFKTVELPKEASARQRRSTQCSETNTSSMEFTGARVKKLNLNIYKCHAMGNYMRTIRIFGEGESTQL